MKRMIALAGLLSIGGASPVQAWWQYAEWNLSSSQIAAASGGQAGPCRDDEPACATPVGGYRPAMLAENITMIGMPASVSFAFNAKDELVQTLVYFPGSPLDLIERLMQGVHGEPVDAAAAQRVWLDMRRNSTITALPSARGSVLLYRPTGQ